MCATVHVTSGLSAMEMFAAVGIVADVHNPPRHLELFAAQADRAMDACRALVEQEEMTPEAAADFQQLLLDTCARVMCHPIVAGNRYLERFAQGVTFAQARHELQQFSVFAAAVRRGPGQAGGQRSDGRSLRRAAQSCCSTKRASPTKRLRGRTDRSMENGDRPFHLAAEYGRRAGPEFEDLAKISDRHGREPPPLSKPRSLLCQHGSEHRAGGVVRHRKLGRE